MRTAARLCCAVALAAFLLLAARPGFRSARQFEEHYQKHGSEFGNISKSDYQRLAQELRDAPVGGPILEAIKPGGVITRFDRRRAISARIIRTARSAHSLSPTTASDTSIGKRRGRTDCDGP